MASQKETQNLNLTQATEFVEDFFGHNTPLVETFVTLYIYMLKQNSGFLIRTNGEILGVARMEEHYRFYVSKKRGGVLHKVQAPLGERTVYGNRGEAVYG